MKPDDVKTIPKIKKFIMPLLWPFGISVLWCMLSIPATNMDAGNVMSGPNGEDYVTPISDLWIVKLFWAPFVLIHDYVPNQHRNIIAGAILTILMWTVILFTLFLLKTFIISKLRLIRLP